MWVALLLAPLFSEVELLGVKLKREVEKAKDELKREIVALKTDITSAVDIRTHISPHIYLSPPADSQLPTIEDQVKRAVELTLAGASATPPGESGPVRQLDDDIVSLFRTRRDLEIELRRIAGERQVLASGRPVGGFQIARSLSQSEILSPGLFGAIRDVYAICSPAVHGEPVTPAQISFVREVGPGLLKALRAVH